MIVYAFFTGNGFARCTYCASDLNISHSGRNDVISNIRSKHHKEMAKSCFSKSISSFVRPPTNHKVIEAEAVWTIFVAKHNLAFETSNHATKLFHRIFPDSEIAKKFACGHSKTTAIIKEALAPHCLSNSLHDMSKVYSVMMDESNDKNKCIILVRVFDLLVGDVRTRFLDMPVVNIGTAKNLFDVLKESLRYNGLDFSRCLAFKSNTTNVMKGTRSGIHKLIRDECSDVFDVGCICHLVDLAIKAGMQPLPADIDHLFVDDFFYFFHSCKRKEEFCVLFLHQNHRQYLSTVLLDGLAFCDVFVTV